MNYENYYPIHTALILEKSTPIIWTNKSMEFNTISLWVDSSWYFLINQIFKNEYYYQNSWITEQTCVDNFFNFELIKKNSRINLFNIYYSYFTKFRTILITDVSENIFSIDTLFKNCNWLERETSEMYGINFLFKQDTRKLLLDYSKIEHPMLKNFPSEGVKDVFYDIMDNQVTYINNETTEL